MDKLLLIDTYNFLHRAYHALPSSFRDPNGEPTNAVYGVTSMLINVFSQIRPNYVIAALDTPEATFRIEDFTAYKAHRKPMDEDLESQIPKVMEVLDAFGIKSIAVRGYEADDVIATVTEKVGGKVEVIIISNDRDLWQLAGKSTHILLPGSKGDNEWLGPAEVNARFGFNPDKIADYKGLRGDPSDNIPGVYGVGEKIATSLIQKFGSLEDIYKNIDNVTPNSLKEKLLNSYEQALMSKKLACLIKDVPLSFELKECRYSEVNKLKVKAILEKYNFKSLIRRMGFEVEGTGKKTGPKEPPRSDKQLSLI